MTLNSSNTSAHPVANGERLNLVVHGIEELNKKETCLLYLKTSIFCGITPCGKSIMKTCFTLVCCLV
jgi:hypothetical protein